MHTFPSSFPRCFLAGCFSAAILHAEPSFDVHLPATPESIVMGSYSALTPPVLKIKSGQTVKIDTLNSTELNQADYTKLLETNGISLDTPYIKETLAALAAHGGSRRLLTGMEDSLLARSFLTSTHGGAARRLLTGPIYVEGAEPGDTLEVRVLDLVVQSDFAINRTISNIGHPLAYMTTAPQARIYKLDRAAKKILFNPAIELPMWPYLGEMGIAPSEETGIYNANKPTNITGGSLDCPDLGKGATIYFPVQTSGALFHAGAGKAAGANGKVNYFSMEVPLTAYLQFIVHKGLATSTVRAETSTHFITFGIASMLDVSMRLSCLEIIDFLKDKAGGLDFFHAYSLGSLAIDFNITRATTPSQLIHATIPKYIFLRYQPADYWYDGELPAKYYLPGNYYAPTKQAIGFKNF